MEKKYEFTTEEKNGLKRIKAIRSFGNVLAGELGGFIEKNENLSHSGNAWVSDNASVFGDASVFGNAWVSDNASVFGNAWLS